MSRGTRAKQEARDTARFIRGVLNDTEMHVCTKQFMLTKGTHRLARIEQRALSVIDEGAFSAEEKVAAEECCQLIDAFKESVAAKQAEIFNEAQAEFERVLALLTQQ